MAAKKEVEYRFLLVGVSGSGKSSTANSIMGENAFAVSTGLDAGTKTCEVRKSSKPQKGITIRIADTPGLFDPQKSIEEIKEEIIKAVANLYPGLHAILYVIKIGRYTPQEQETFNHLKSLFDPSVVNYVIIIFTGGDQLKKEKMSLEAFLDTAVAVVPFKQVLYECGKRVIVFNNKKHDTKKTKELLTMVDQIWRENGEAPYICPLQRHVNVKLERTVSMRTQEKIQKDPALKELFASIAESARRAMKEAEDQDKLLEASMHEKLMKEKMLADKLAENEEEERKMKEQQKEEKERQERAEKEKRELEESKKREEEERERKRQEEEKKAEEQRERKRRDQEAEELRKEIEKLKKDQEVAQKVKEEKQKMQEEFDKKLAEETEKQNKKQMEETKQNIAENKEKDWTHDVVEGAANLVGGAWKAARAWLRL